jgi:hypothetical protein
MATSLSLEEFFQLIVGPCYDTGREITYGEAFLVLRFIFQQSHYAAKSDSELMVFQPFVKKHELAEIHERHLRAFGPFEECCVDEEKIYENCVFLYEKITNIIEESNATVIQIHRVMDKVTDNFGLSFTARCKYSVRNPYLALVTHHDHFNG